MIGLYSKRTEYTGFPQNYDRAKGVYIWVDGVKLLDMAYMGIGCNILGYSDPTVNYNVIKALTKGSMTSLVSNYESYLEYLLCDSVYKNIRFARSGGEAVKIALTLAMTDKVMTCGYHGWHIKNMQTVEFEYNNIDDFKSKLTDDIGAVIIEPIRNKVPVKEFFQELASICKERGIKLILDEITTGFRFRAGGYYKLLDIEPDMVVFGKGISNGIPFSCVLYKEEPKPEPFISSTYFTDALGPAAAIATILKLRDRNYTYLGLLGRAIQGIWGLCSSKYNIEIEINRVPELASFSFVDYHDEYRSIFVQEMLKYSILANTHFYPSFAHRPKHIKQYEYACDKAFRTIQGVRNDPLSIINGVVLKDKPVPIRT